MKQEILTNKEIQKFLEYKDLDSKQKEMILNIIKKIKELDKEFKLFPAQFHKYNIKKVPLTKIKDFETRKKIILPPSFRWFLQEVGEGYCPGQYSFGISTKEAEELDINSKDFSDMIFYISFEGCTFYNILGLNEKNYGKVANFCADIDIDTIVEAKSRKKAIESLENLNFEDDFLDWYKKSLINELKKLNKT